ncbi:hypothetical protein PT2222_200004 [Paraburkholderia tropica]
MGEGGFAHPRAFVVRLHARAEALAVARAVAVDDAPEFFPVDRAVVVVAARLVPFQVGVGQSHAEHFGLLDRGVDELLAQIVVRDALDAPFGRLVAVDRVGVARAEHHQHRPPPAVHGLLHEFALRLGALHHREQGVETLALMKRLFLADADHGARIRAVGAAAQRDLVHDRRAVDQPADHADVRPGGRRVVEDARILGLARVQGVDQLVARDAERFRRAIEIEAVARLVLHLGEQDRLALQTRRARNPVAFRQHAHDFRVRVLRDLAHQRLAVGIGHPVLRLDLAVGGHDGVEPDLLGRVGARVERGDMAGNVEGLRVHGDALAVLGMVRSINQPTGR